MCNKDNFFSPSQIKKELLLSTYDEDYYNNLINLSLSNIDSRQIDFGMILRSLNLIRLWNIFYKI